MSSKTVIILIWKITGRIEAFVNLGKLYSVHTHEMLGVSRYTLDRKDLYRGYENEIIKIHKLYIR